MSHSPIAVADELKWLVKDKVVCDLGCGTGELLEQLSKYASRVIGIEKDIALAKKLIERGFEVINGDFLDGTSIPEADIYYIWIAYPYPIIDKIKKGLLIIGTDFLDGEKKFDFEKYPFSKVAIPYGDKQFWNLAVTYKDDKSI